MDSRWPKKAWIWLHSTLGRAAAAIAAFACLIWFLWPEQNWHVHPDALASLIMTSVAWIVSLSPVGKKPSVHDLALFGQFQNLILEKDKLFLRDFDLGNSFDFSHLDGLDTLCRTWKGANYEFDDKVIQAQLAALIAKAHDFVNKAAFESTPLNGRWVSLVPAHERGSFFSNATKVKVDAFNKQATELVDDIDKFIKFSRQKLDA